MSQFDFGTIDPNVKTGTQLASDLNQWRTAVHSTHAGAARPSYASPGMLWVDQTSASDWKLKLATATGDTIIGGINPTTNVSVSRFPDGTFAAPSIAFASEPGLGIYRSGQGSMNIAANFLTLKANGNGHAFIDIQNDGSGKTCQIRSYTNTSMRWRMMFGNGDAESSGNAGSDFQLNRFGDAGNDLGTTLLIFRATGAFKAVGNQAPAAGVSEHEFNNNVDGGLYGLRVRNSAPTSGHGIHLMLPSVGDNSSCNFITGANSAGYRFGVMSNSGIYNNQSANSNWSDANVKQNIVPSPDYTAFVEQLQFKRFSYVSDPTYETDDVIAQELEALDQSLVTTVEGTRAVYSHRLQQRINSVIPRLIARIKALEAKQ